MVTRREPYQDRQDQCEKRSKQVVFFVVSSYFRLESSDNMNVPTKSLYQL